MYETWFFFSFLFFFHRTSVKYFIGFVLNDEFPIFSGDLIGAFLRDGNWEGVASGVYEMHLQVFIDGVRNIVSAKIRLLAEGLLQRVYHGGVTKIKTVFHLLVFCRCVEVYVIASLRCLSTLQLTEMCAKEESLKHDIDDLNHQLLLATTNTFMVKPGVIIKIVFSSCICDGKTKAILSQKKTNTWDSDEFNGGDADVALNTPAFDEPCFRYADMVHRYERQQLYMSQCEEKFRVANGRSFNETERSRIEDKARIIFNSNCNSVPLFARPLPSRFGPLAGQRLDVSRLLWVPGVDHMMNYVNQVQIISITYIAIFILLVIQR